MKWLIVILAGCLLPLAAACNDDGGTMSLEAYFNELERIDGELEQRSDELEQELGEPPTDAEIDDSFRDLLRDNFRAQLSAFDDFIEGFKDLSPPEEVESLHADGEDALDDLREVFNGTIDKILGLESEDDFETIFADVEEPEARVNEICADLQKVATDNNIEVDLNCNEDE